MPPKFTPENRGALIERTAAGVSLPDACRALELRLPTVKSWLTRGRREGEGPYAEFAAAIQAAREEARNRPEPMDEAELLLVISDLARKGSVQAARLRWEMICAERKSDDEEPQAEDPQPRGIDELATRRAGRA